MRLGVLVAGAWVLACGPNDTAAGGNGIADGSSTGHARDDEGTTPTSSTGGSIDGGSGSASGSGSSDSGSPMQTWCVVVHPIAELVALDPGPVLAHTRTDGRVVVWRIEQTWDPFTEILSLSLVPNTVDADGVASPGAPVETTGTFELFADIDGDGLEDLITFDAGTLLWRAADGEDGFAAPVTLELPSASAIASFDGDGDGAMDVFTRDDGAFATLWSGDGHGEFAATATLTTGLDPDWRVAEVWPAPAGQLLLDVQVVWSDFATTRSVWRAELEAGALIPTQSSATDAFEVRGTADFDADLRIDVVTSFVDGDVHVLHGIDAGFEDTRIADSAWQVVVADVLGSGSESLLLTDFDGNARVFAAPYDPGVAAIDLHGDAIGDGRLAAADLDGDGTDDMLRTRWNEAGYDVALVRVQPCD